MSKYIELILALWLFAGCTVGKTPLEDDRGYDGDDNDTRSGLVSIAALKSMYVNRPVSIDSEIMIRGRVVSSDMWGNFYKTLCIEDESGGIAVRIDVEEYYRIFTPGDVVTVYCNSLTLGIYAGAHQLGVQDSGSAGNLTYIPEDYILSSVTVRSTGEEPPYSTVTIPGLTFSDIHRYVEIRDIQFDDFVEFTTWCEEDVDTDRTVVDRNGNRLEIRTSRYADFAGDLLPEGSGFIRGVVGYFNGSYQLTLLNATYAVMEGERF